MALRDITLFTFSKIIFCVILMSLSVQSDSNSMYYPNSYTQNNQNYQPVPMVTGTGIQPVQVMVTKGPPTTPPTIQEATKNKTKLSFWVVMATFKVMILFLLYILYEIAYVGVPGIPQTASPLKLQPSPPKGQQLRIDQISRQFFHQLLDDTSVRGKKMKVGDQEGHGNARILTRIWAWILVHIIAFKFNGIELFTKHRKFNIEGVGKKRSGDVAVVTGGARGIGVEVVKKLLQCDMYVIIGCRNTSAGNQVIKRIRDEGTSTGKADVLPLDLMSLDSVKEFAQQVNAKTNKINLLINNAGVMFLPYSETVDGFETHFQVNYLSHFLLARLFHQSLIKGGQAKSGEASRQSRIINVSSCASYGGDVDFSDLQLKRNYCKYNVYMVTKFLQVVFSNMADRKYREEGAPIRSYALHPGIVKTDLYDSLWWIQCFRFITPYLFKSPAQGADTIVYAALSPDIENEGGIFLANSQRRAPNPKSNDTKLQDNLWDTTCNLLDNKLNH